MDERRQSSGCSLDEVLITDQLAHRSVRSRDPHQENQALAELTNGLVSDPGDLLDRLATAITVYCHADAAGISVLEPSVGEPTGNTQVVSIFRWYAVAGAFADHAGATLARHQSPCGMAFDRREPLLFDRPHRYFGGFEWADPPVAELLTLPFYIEGEPRGTIWAVTHHSDPGFDAEDLRLLEELAPFASVGQRLHSGATLREHANVVLQRAYRDQSRRSARLRQFATGLTSAENRARRHFATELQENLQQMLVAARMQLASGDGQIEPIGRANALIDEAVSVSRRLVAELRPPSLYELGLVPALRWFADDLRNRELLDAQIECDEAEIDAITLNDDTRALLFEGVQELLGNVIRHSGAKTATVTIATHGDGVVSVAVFDPGHGTALDATKLDSSQGLGLFGIRERLTALGGWMHIDSTERHGTRVELHVPYGLSDETASEP